MFFCYLLFYNFPVIYREHLSIAYLLLFQVKHIFRVVVFCFAVPRHDQHCSHFSSCGTLACPSFPEKLANSWISSFVHENLLTGFSFQKIAELLKTKNKINRFICSLFLFFSLLIEPADLW